MSKNLPVFSNPFLASKGISAKAKPSLAKKRAKESFPSIPKTADPIPKIPKKGTQTNKAKK